MLSAVTRMASCTSLVRRVVAIVIVTLVARNAVTGNDTSNCGQADVLFILDSSGSIGAEDYQHMLKSVAALTTEFPIGPNAMQFSVMTFSSTVENVFRFTTYKTNAELKEAILNVSYLGNMTYTGAALRTARTYSFTPANGARPNVTKIALCITDGLSTYVEDTQREAYRLKSSGVSVIAVGVGANTEYSELKTIASSPSLVLNVTDYKVLDAVRSQISKAVCQEATNPTKRDSCIGESGCIGQSNGNYRACKPECERGFYYTCDHQFATRMQCGFGNYKAANGSTFTARLVYVQESNSCQLEAGYCPRVPQNYAESQPSPSTYNYTYQRQPCLGPSDGCAGKLNGNYPLCFPECQDGNYASCSNGERHIMPCALGWYTDSNNTRYTAKMVFDADTGKCQLTSTSCPRQTPPRTEPLTPGPQPNPDTPQCEGEADIVLVIDASGSIGKANYEMMKRFVAGVTTHFTVGPKKVLFSAVIFSSNVNFIFKFADFTTKDEVYQALLNAPYLAGGTDTAAALRSVREMGFSSENGARKNVSKIALLVTDGESNSPNETASEAALTKKAGITCISVGVGPGADGHELLVIASSPDHVFEVNNFNVLEAIKSALVISACNNRTTPACVDNSCLERRDGNYPACNPGCQDGYFYSCSKQFANKMDCPLAWYTFKNGTRFLAKMVYNPQTNTCEMETNYCLRDPTKHVVPLPPSSTPPTGAPTSEKPCLSTPDGCSGKPSGNYPVCYPECQKGYYYMCSNNEAYRRECAVAWYTSAKGERFTDRTVYDPSTETCQMSSSSCPRPVTQAPTPRPTTTTTEQPVPTCHEQADVLFIVDSSGSLGKNNYATMISFVAILTRYFNIGPANVRVSVLIFSTEVKIQFNFTEYLDNAGVYRSILSLPYMEMGTNTGAALRLARLLAFTSANGARPNVNKAAIVLTDGISEHANETAREAYLLKQSGVKMMAIGIGSETLDRELLAIASSPSLVYNVSGFDVLNSIVREVVITTCQTITTTRPTTTTTTTTTTRPTTTTTTTTTTTPRPTTTTTPRPTTTTTTTTTTTPRPTTTTTTTTTPRPTTTTTTTTTTTPRPTTTTTRTTTPSCVSGNCAGRRDGTYESCPDECLQGHYYVCNNGTTKKMTCDMMKYTEGDRVMIVRGVWDPVFKSCKAVSKSCPRNTSSEYSMYS